MHTVFADFYTNRTKVLAKLSTGEEIECYTALIAQGLYSNWWECPCEPQHGKVNYVETDIFEETISPMYNDEWEFVDENKQQYLEENIDAFEDVRIVDIIKTLEFPEWEVDEDSIDYERYEE